MSLSAVFPLSGSVASENLAPTKQGVVQVLVKALGDASPAVHDAAFTALRTNACRDWLLVADTCQAAIRSAKRGATRGAYHARLLQSLAIAIQNMEEDNEEHASLTLMQRTARLAVAELAAHPKELESEWQLAAGGVLLAVGVRAPHVMMAEAFATPPGSQLPLPAIVRTLGNFSQVDGAHFLPYLKDALMRVVPPLGSIPDTQRHVFATAMGQWSQAVTSHHAESALPSGSDQPSPTPLDSDSQAFMYSAFELFLLKWLGSRHSKVQLATAEALGQMAPVLARTQLKASLPRLLPSLLSLCRVPREIPPWQVTGSLHAILETCLVPPHAKLLDFPAVAPVLAVLLPMAAPTAHPPEDPAGASASFKNCNEVMGCMAAAASTFPDSLCTFLLQRLAVGRDDEVRLGAFAALRFLIARLEGEWAGKRSLLLEAVRPALQERDLAMRKAIAQVIAAMAVRGYLEEQDRGEPFVEFLVRQCTLSDSGSSTDRSWDADAAAQSSREPSTPLPQWGSFDARWLNGGLAEETPEQVSAWEVRGISEQSLLLMSSTLPTSQALLWPALLRVLAPPKYTRALPVVCRCLAVMARRSLETVQSLPTPLPGEPTVPSPMALLARFMVLLRDPASVPQLAPGVLDVMELLAPVYPGDVASRVWAQELPRMRSRLERDSEHQRRDTWQQRQPAWDEMLLHLLGETLDAAGSREWTRDFGECLASHYVLYPADAAARALLHRCLGVVLQRTENRVFVRHAVDLMYSRADLHIAADRQGLAQGMGVAAASHLDVVLQKLQEVLECEGLPKQHWLARLFEKKGEPSADDVCASLALIYGYAARYAPPAVIEARINTLVGTNVLTRLLDVRSPAARRAVITAIDLLAKAVGRAAERGNPFPLKDRDSMIGYVLAFMDVPSPPFLSSSSAVAAAASAAAPAPALGPVPGFSSAAAAGRDVLSTVASGIGACTSLVCTEPKLLPPVRESILQRATAYYALPEQPFDLIDPVMENLKVLLCAVLKAGAEGGLGHAELLHHMLRQLDPFVASPVPAQRARACHAVLALLAQFRTLCTGVSPCNSDSGTAPASPASPALLPARGILRVGERASAYLARCCDSEPQVRVAAVQILDSLLSAAAALPCRDIAEDDAPGSASAPAIAPAAADAAAPAAALSLLHALVAAPHAALADLEEERPEVIMEREGMEGGGQEHHLEPPLVRHLAAFKSIVSCVCVFLTPAELVDYMKSARVGLCDATAAAASGARAAMAELITRRGRELALADVPGVMTTLLSSATWTTSVLCRRDVLAMVSLLGQHGDAGAVFDQLLLSVPRDPTLWSRRDAQAHTKTEKWPIQEALQAVASTPQLGGALLDHLISILQHAELPSGMQDAQRAGPLTPTRAAKASPVPFLPQAATVALLPVLRARGVQVEAHFAALACALLLRMAATQAHTATDAQPLRDAVDAFQLFCSCSSAFHMRQVLSKDGEQRLQGDMWLDVIGELAGCAARARGHLVEEMCGRLWPALASEAEHKRAAAASALSQLILQSGREELMQSMMDAFCVRCVDDPAPGVRRTCITGLAQIPGGALAAHGGTKVLQVALGLLQDEHPAVALAALNGVPKLLELVPEEAARSNVPTLCASLRSLQSAKSERVRAAAFATLGALARLGAPAASFSSTSITSTSSTPAACASSPASAPRSAGAPSPPPPDARLHDTLLEEIHAFLPRLVLHLLEESPGVRSACRHSLRAVGELLPPRQLARLLLSSRSLTSSSDSRVMYEKFVRDIARQLAEEHEDRTQTYIGEGLQAFESPWPEVQANAAYFVGCHLSCLQDHHYLDDNLPQVTASLVKMCASSPSALVRAKATASLTLILPVIDLHDL